MTTTAIPSLDIDDFKANIQDFDTMLNGAGVYSDRFGKERLTLDAFMAANGFEVPVSFASGIAVSRTTQTVTYEGNTYHAAPSALPFTTTGTFNAAQWALLRQNADNVTSATLTITGFTASALIDGAWIHFAGRDTVGDGGGGMFRYSASSTQTADGGTVFAPAGGGRLLREGWTVFGFNGCVSPFWFGAKGDGTADDTSELSAMFATGYEWHIPSTSGGFLISDTVTIASDGSCAGFIKTASGFDKIAVTFANPGYGSKRYIRGLEVRAESVRVANSAGIRVAYPSIVLDRCKTTRFDYGIQVWSYSVMLLNCVSQLNNTNLSAYAPSSTSEINDLKIIGGNYDSAVQYSCRIGDPRFSTTVAAGNPFGTSVTLIGANFDGAVSTFDRIFSLNINGCYYEGPASGNAIELGGSGDNYLRNVEISGCYFSRVQHAIFCKNAVQGLTVRPNYYSAIDYCALYAVNVNVSGFTYEKGVSNGFEYPEVHTGFTFTTAADLKFSGITNTADFLVNGVQYATSTSETNSWYPNGRTRDGMRHVSSVTGRFYNTIATGISGTMSGNAFTCTTASDAKKFNGGDKITGASGSSYVRFVDYVNGIIYVDASGSGSYTISHDGAAVFIGEHIVGSGSPEGVATARPGSLYTNISGGANTTLYVKESGTGNTGWVAK